MDARDIALSVMAAQLLTEGEDNNPGNIDALFDTGVTIDFDKYNELVNILDGRSLRVTTDLIERTVTVSFEYRPDDRSALDVLLDAILTRAGHTGQPDCPACQNATPPPPFDRVAPESPLEERAAHGDA